MMRIDLMEDEPQSYVIGGKINRTLLKEKLHSKFSFEEWKLCRIMDTFENLFRMMDGVLKAQDLLQDDVREMMMKEFRCALFRENQQLVEHNTRIFDQIGKLENEILDLKTNPKYWVAPAQEVIEEPEQVSQGFLLQLADALRMPVYVEGGVRHAPTTDRVLQHARTVMDAYEIHKAERHKKTEENTRLRGDVEELLQAMGVVKRVTTAATTKVDDHEVRSRAS